MDSRPNRGRGAKRPRFDGQAGAGNKNWQSRNGRPRRRNRRTPQGDPSTMRDKKDDQVASSSSQPPKCSVCHVAELPKYKCPKCRQSYCSIACCQQHKVMCSTQPLPAEFEQAEHGGDCKPSRSKYLPPGLVLSSVVGEITSSIRRDNINARHHEEDDDDDLDEDWKITAAMKESVNRCDWLKRELQDSGLRQLITQTVAASRIVQRNGKTEQENVLDNNKTTNPMFANFCDKLLVVSGILERQDEGPHNDNDLEDWLNRKPEELGQLVLKPIPRQRLRPVHVASIEQHSDAVTNVKREECSSDESSSEESDVSDDNTSSEDDSS